MARANTWRSPLLASGRLSLWMTGSRGCRMARRNHTASWIPAAVPVPRHGTSNMLLRSRPCSTSEAWANIDGLCVELFLYFWQ